MKVSWLTPKADRCAFDKRGVGIIARQDFAQDEPIAVWGGAVMAGEQFFQQPIEWRRRSVQIGENLYLVPYELTYGDFVNHSCDPNAGLAGDRTLVAIRPIHAGEEITYDYAMTDMSQYDEFDCHCGSNLCRKHVRGSDWMLPELQMRYRGYFSCYIERVIEG